MRVLVTGSSGFVGRHFADRLVADGHEVLGLDIEKPPGDTTFVSLRRDTRFLPTTEFAYPFDLVVHCAALVGGRARIEGDPLSLAVNLEIDAALFRWAARVKPGRLVYFSSSAAYPVCLQTGRLSPGLRPPPRLEEDDIAIPWVDAFGVEEPDGTYGLAKVVGEVLATHLRNEGVPVTVIRPFSGYGSDQSLDYPFPSFIKRARENQRPFEIWGTGQQVRDWVHIDDVVGLTLAAVDQGLDGPFNACTGRPTSFLELARLVLAERWRPHGGIAGLTDSDFLTCPDKPAGVAYRVGDPTLSHRVYTPQVTLEQGIRRALDAS